MKNKVNLFWLFVGIVLAIGIYSLTVGEFAWRQLLITVGILFTMEIIRRMRYKKTGISDTDERTISIMKKTFSWTMLLSFIVLFGYLVISKYILNQSTISTDFLIAYITITFFIASVSSFIIEKGEKG
jgi:hypothetical protein